MPMNPCVTCGACCAFFRATFYWGEAGDARPGGVPVHLTRDLTPYRRVMEGTNQQNPRCVALDGRIGHAVGCAIYDRRPSTCRAFTPAYADGRPNPDCDRARAAHGLPPLTPADYGPPPEHSPPVTPAA